MGFTFLGKEIENINFNGSPLDRLQFNGVTVWERSSGDYVLIPNDYYEGEDGQWYQMLVKYGEMIPGCTVETPGTSSTSYGWITDTESTGKVEGYTYLMSDNKGKSSTWAAAKISWSGLTSVTFYYRSYAESSYDYMVLSTLDFAGWSTQPSSGSSGVYVHTNNKQTTTFNTVTYECSTDPHHIWIAYRKDGSVDREADRGYFGYITEKQEILDVKAGSLLPSEYVWDGDATITIDGKRYQKLEREYTLPNGNKIWNFDDYQVGEEITTQLRIIRADANSQFIDIPVEYSTGSKMVAKFSITGAGGGVFIGAPAPSTAAEDEQDFRIFMASSGIFYYDAGSGRLQTGSAVKKNTVYEFEIGQFYVKNLVTGSNILSGSQSGSYSKSTFRIFNNNAYGGTGKDYGDVYYVKLYDQTGTLVLDLIPWEDERGWFGFKNLIDNAVYTNSTLIGIYE